MLRPSYTLFFKVDSQLVLLFFHSGTSLLRISKVSFLFLSDKSFSHLHILDTLILEGLRDYPHVAHAHFELAFKWISLLKPKKTYLTHFSPESDHDYVKKLCPKNVEPAYDGLKINI